MFELPVIGFGGISVLNDIIKKYTSEDNYNDERRFFEISFEKRRKHVLEVILAERIAVILADLCILKWGRMTK